MPSIAAHAIVPPDKLPAPDTPESVLDTTPARVSRPTVEGAVQDVRLQLPGDGGSDEPFPALTVTFRMDADELGTVVAETADLAYVAAGGRGLKALEDALHGTSERAVGGVLGATGPDKPVAVRGEGQYIDDDRTPMRGRLLTEFANYIETLTNRQAAAQAAVQKAAVSQAKRRLKASRQQVIEEARRYLSLSGDDGAAASVLMSSAPNRVTGPETMDLVKDLIAIANARATLAIGQVQQKRTEDAWNRTKLGILADHHARAGGSSGYMTDRQAYELGRDIAAMGDSPEVVMARKQVTDERETLARLVAERAAIRPVLYRLWQTDAPLVALRVIRSSRAGSVIGDRAAVLDSVALREAVAGPLRSTYQTAVRLGDALDGDPELVWQYRPLIEASLEDLFAGEGDFVGRAVQDKVEAEAPGSDLAVVSEWLGYAQLVSALSGAEPVAAALTTAQIGVGLTSVVVKAFSAWRQQVGEDSFLRPSARLGSPPYYTDAVLDALDVAIGVFTDLPFDTKMFRNQ